MKLTKSILRKFNNENSIILLSSYPAKNGEVAVENAVSRYTHLLVKSFPKNQNVVVLCEKRDKGDEPWLNGDNVLVVPTYTLGSPKFFYQVTKKFMEFDLIKDIHVQFEFSIFGGKIAIPGFVGSLVFAKTLRKHVSIMLHQVVVNIDSLSGHLGISKQSRKSMVLDKIMKDFYRSIGLICDVVVVHDQNLKDRLSLYVDKNMIQVIPHGIGNTKKLSANKVLKSKNSYGLSQEDFVVTAFGYHSWYKGTDWIVKKFSDHYRKYPNSKIKLLLAGGESPTLKGTLAYKKYSQKMHNLIGKHDKNIVYTNYVPEKMVPSVFAASNVIIFPYRARMSASGALALAWQYTKPFLVSKQFSENLREIDVLEEMSASGVAVSDVTFDMNNNDLFNKISKLKKDKGLQRNLSCIGKKVTSRRKWDMVARQYLEIIKSNPMIASNSALSPVILR